MTLTCLFPWVSKRSQSPSALSKIHVLSSKNWNGQLVETHTWFQNQIFFFFWYNPEKGLFYFDSIIYKWLWYKSTGQINYPSNWCSTGLSGWMGLCKTAKMKEKKNLAGQEKECSPDILQKQDKSLQTAVTAYTTNSPTCFFSRFFYSLDPLRGLFYPAYNSHFNSRI